MMTHGLPDLRTVYRYFGPLVLVKVGLVIIYFTSITQKDHGTYIHVLEGVDVGIIWPNVVKETREPGVNPRPWMGDHSPATCPGMDLNLYHRGDK